MRNKVILVLAVATLISCKKWKEPTEVGFYMDITETSSIDGQLTFTGGEIVLEYFEFDGERQKGDDVFFTKDFQDGLTIPFDETMKIEAMDFVIPQGIYKRLDIRFKTSDDLTEVSLVVTGNYSFSGGGSVPVRFEIENTQSFEARAEAEDGADIVLDKDIYSPAKIILDPAYWFEPVPASSFDDADLTDIEGVNTLLISKDVNEEIYNMVLDRVDEAVVILFNYQ
ncbi:MAG: hypothetical protein HYZ14_12435 [Bacteroidetes bacterium]|nr:hypothetical protein [Bacteroidota bacterium]